MTQPKGWGALIREARERKGWTQVELGERTGIGPTTISNIEREANGGDGPSRDQVNALVLALGLSAEELLLAMGYRLTPTAASRLPRRLLVRLLEMTPEQLGQLTDFVDGLMGSRGQD